LAKQDADQILRLKALTYIQAGFSNCVSRGQTSLTNRSLGSASPRAPTILCQQAKRRCGNQLANKYRFLIECSSSLRPHFLIAERAFARTIIFQFDE
jgi:hypothetical protein